jgi:exodeoxyribonuclease VII small subunit
MTAENGRPFEELYRELEDVVRRLESGELALADVLLLFEQGARLAGQCNQMLDQAELRVRQLTARTDGTLTTAPFDGWQDSGK